MLASRILLRTSRSNAIAIGLRQSVTGKISSVTVPASARLFSSIQASPLKRPSVLSSSVARQSSIASLTSARFNSTTSTPPTTTTAPEAAPTPTTPSSEFAPFDSFDFTTLDEAQKSIPEHIGFLKELGLNFGWGPTTCMQWLLEHIHVWSGMPWFASVVLATVIIRVLQLPGYLKQSDLVARLKEVDPFTAPIMAKLKKAQLARDYVSMHVLKQELNGVYSKAGVARIWLIWPILQLPVFYGFYNLLWSMAKVPVPGLVNGGIAWFENLAVADPLHILPLISAASIALTIARGGDAGGGMREDLRKLLLVVLPTATIVFLWKWPAVLTIYFATSSLLALCQAFALKNPSIRSFFGLYPLPPPTIPSPLKIVDDPVTPPPTEAVDTRKMLSDKFKNLMEKGRENTPLKVTELWDKMTDNAKDKRFRSYDKMREEEEARRKREIIEEKKIRKMMKNKM